MKNALAVAALGGCVAISPAHGQIWIGQIAGDVVRNANRPPPLDVRCMTGRAIVSERHVRRTRNHAIEMMGRYLAYVRAAEVADVSELYGPFAKDGVWRLNDNQIAVTQVSDPLSSHQVAELEEPDAFVASGDRNGAGAIWVVRDNAGQVVGHYRGYFRRAGSRWSISDLDVVEGTAEPIALDPFCTSPGDIERFLAAHDESGRARWDDVEKPEDE